MDRRRLALTLFLRAQGREAHALTFDQVLTHAARLKLNATKSLLGHTMSACGLVELTGAILQMRAGQLHASINIDERDPEVDLDVVANAPIRFPVRYLMKNAFGFGGLNASAIVARYEDGLD